MRRPLMRRILFVVLCLSGMLGFAWICRYLVYGVSRDFGIGVGVGFALAVILIYLAQRADGKRFLDR